MNMVQQHWPLHTLRSLGSILAPFWAQNAGVVGGENVMLRALENDVLRAMGDPPGASGDQLRLHELSGSAP
jgi:hypothetical protein